VTDSAQADGDVLPAAVPATWALPSAPTGSVGPADGDLSARLTRAEAERDAALAALDKQGHKDRRRSKTMQFFVGVLVVLFAILLPVTYVVTWAHRVALNTDTFVKTVGPAASNPAVTEAAATAITNQIYQALDPEQIVANALPPKASFLAGPIASGTKGFVQDGVNKALQTSQFQALWTQTLRFAHAQLLSVLNGNSKALTTTNGQVVLNLVPLFNSVLQDLQGFVSGVVGKQVTLPPIQGGELPSAVCQRIATALNRPVPSTCGQIPLFPASKLTQARWEVRLLNGATVLLLILTPIVGALALWVSRRRRRTLMQLSVGALLGLVVVRRLVDWLSSSLVNSGDSANRAARHAILAQLFHNYFSISRWLIVALLAVVIVAWVSGPYPWAKSLRRYVSHYSRDGWNLVVAAIGGRGREDATIAWMRSHLELLQVLGVVVAVLLLLILSVSWVGFTIVALLLAGYELWMHRIGQAAITKSELSAVDAAPVEGADGAQSAPPRPGPAPAA
jgi:hypothetical protein